MERHLGKFGKMIIQSLFDGIFRDKTVFVTGHTGFIGSWLSLWLKLLGAKVIGYSLPPPTNPSLFEIIDLDKEVIHIEGDISNISFLLESIKKYKPDFVFHLAAQSLVRFSYEKPIETFHTNIMGTANLLEVVRNVSSVKSCVIMTSDKCYENREWSYAYRENDPMGGFDPYSASKGAAELVIASFRNSFFKNLDKQKHGIGIASVRAGNVIGGGDWAKDRIIPDCIRSILAKKSINIRNPNAVRPWQYVLEPLAGLLWLSSKIFDNPSKYAEPWNFGPSTSNREITVKELVLKIIDEWQYEKSVKISRKDQYKLHEASSLKLDITKATSLLGWFPVYSINESILETVNWYKEFLHSKSDMKKITIKQIENYVQKAKENGSKWT